MKYGDRKLKRTTIPLLNVKWFLPLGKMLNDFFQPSSEIPDDTIIF